MTTSTRKGPAEMAAWRIQDAIARALPNAIGAVPNENEGYDYPGGEGHDMERIVNTLTEAISGAIRVPQFTNPGSVPSDSLPALPNRAELVRRFASVLDGTGVTEQTDVFEALADAALRGTPLTAPQASGDIPSDPMAVERLRTLIVEALIAPHSGVDLHEIAASAAAKEIRLEVLRNVTFQHDVNSAGVPMRRVVAYGEWEIDPEPAQHAYPTPPERTRIEAAAGRALTEDEILHRRSSRNPLNYVLREDYDMLKARYDYREARLRDLLAAVGPEGDGEDGWSKHAIDRVREAYTGVSTAEYEAGKRTEQTGVRCAEESCQDYGSRDMGEGTCPVEHAAPTFD